jgi:SNF2 family DNA or RNA helicase
VIEMLELRPYQKAGLDFLRANPRAFLADEMGLGKSAQMILASEGKVLVVAPAMVLDGGTWRDEIAKWAPERAEDFTTVAYSSLVVRQGRKVLPIAKDEYRRPRWDTVILDEAHYIKGRKTTWTKALKPILKKAGRVILATGTPIPNWAPELFEALCAMYPEKAVPGGEYGSYWRWAGTWFDTTPETVYTRQGPKEVQKVGRLLACTEACDLRPPLDPCEHHRDFFRANLGDRFLMRLRDDVLTDLPPLTVEPVETAMTVKQRKAYDQMRDEYLAEMGDGKLKVAWSSSARHVMLDQCATGLGILDADGDPAAESGKLTRLAYDLGERTRPTLVVAHFRRSVEAAATVAEGLGQSVGVVHGGVSRPARAAIVERFKAGKLDVLCGSLDTVAEGLTLTAADMVIFLETSFKPSRNQQAMRRIHRMGQTRPCTALDYITPDSIDTGKRELLALKTDHQIRILTEAQMAKYL